MAASFPGQYNTYIPNHEASQSLVADFSRNPDKFKLAEWCQYVPVQDNRGFYVEMTVEQAGRLLSTTGDDMRWADGNEAPRQTHGLEGFEFKPYITERFVTGFELGEMAQDQARWDAVAQHARIHAQRLMTFRTQKAATVATTASNYLTAHQIDNASGADGNHPDLNISGKLDVSTTALSDIKRTFNYMFELVYKATLGGVTQDQVLFVMNPLTARRLAVSQEIVNALIQSPYGQQLVEKDLGNFSQWGLPPSLFGYNIVVEDAVKVTTAKGATTSRDYVWPDGTIACISRPGGLEGVEGAPSFSTIQCFLKTEMLVESKHDVDNKRHTGRVIDDFDVRLISQLSGAIIENVLTA